MSTGDKYTADTFDRYTMHINGALIGIVLDTVRDIDGAGPLDITCGTIAPLTDRERESLRSGVANVQIRSCRYGDRYAFSGSVASMCESADELAIRFGEVFDRRDIGLLARLSQVAA